MLGEICVDTLDVVASVGLAEAATVLETSNGFDEDELALVDDEEEVDDDEPDEVSELMASMAADAAPRANNMAETPTNAVAGGNLPVLQISKRRAISKNPVKAGFLAFQQASGREPGPGN